MEGSILTTLALAVGALGLGGLASWLTTWGRRLDADRVSFALRFPKDVTVEAVLAALRPLAGLGEARGLVARSLVFETISRPHRIEHRLHIPTPWVTAVRTHLLTAVPGLWLEPLAPIERNLPLRRGLELGLRGDMATLRTDITAEASRHLLAALQPVGRDEAVMMQWVVSPLGAGPEPTKHRPESQRRSFLVHLLLAVWRSPAAAQATETTLTTQRAKVAEPLFQVAGRVVAAAPSEAAARRLVGRVRGALATVEAPGANFSPRVWLPKLVARRAEVRRTPRWWAAPLNGAELAAVLNWPIDGPELPGLSLRRSRWFTPAPELPRTGRVLGDATTGDSLRPVALGTKAALTHTWVVGKTGSGKSTLLANLVLQDLASPERPGVVVIEPKGDLVRDILPRIPEERRKDVILLDPASEVFVGLNPLRLDEPDRELVADEVYGILKKLSLGWGPRLGDVLYNSLQTLARQPDAALTELPLLLSDDAYRHQVLAGLGEDAWVLRSFWAGFDTLSPAEQALVVAPIMTRLRPWLTRRRLRQLIGVPHPRWNFQQIFSEGKILLVALNTGLLGQETVRLLGSLIFQNLWQAATSRAALPADQRRPVLVYADEWQEYTHLPTDLETMLSQARGYGLGLTLANQSVTQLSAELKAAATAHARSKVVMAAGSADAKHFAAEIGGGVTPDDIQGLGAYEAIASLMVASETARPVSLTTRPLPEPLTDAATVRAQVQANYGLDPTEVEAAIRARHERPTPKTTTHAFRRDQP